MGGFSNPNLQDIGNGLTADALNPQSQAPANNSQNAGPIKTGLRGVLLNMLRSGAYQASQAGLHAAGLPTDQERMLMNARLQQENAQTQETLQNVETQKLNRQMVQRRLQALQAMSQGQDPFSSLGNMNPDEQALVSSARAESQMKGDAEPIFNAIKQIQNQRAIFGRQQYGNILVTPELAQENPELSSFVGKPINASQLASIIRGRGIANQIVPGAGGPVAVNKATGEAKPVMLNGQRVGNPQVEARLAVPREIADPNNPGQTLIVPAGQSFGQAGPQSASVQVPRAAAKAEVPTLIGNQKVAFNTALQHADLLQSAVNALHNGDQQTLNNLQNRFANEFGAPGPVTAQTIAQAYTREINKMLSSGHITDAELKQIGGTVDPMRQSPEQIASVLSGYRALAQSKINMLDAQKNSAISGAIPKAVQNKMPKKSSGFDWGSLPTVQK